ncbi:MAG: metallophosphoesterase [Deferrisomatales bacterium]|nr:metallophosphoesterase [Deferrisomatales bacterium]
MLLGVLSDTHLCAPQGRLRELLAGPLGEAEVLLHAGDYTGETVVDYLEHGDPRPFYGVAGNADPMSVVRRLPATRLLSLAGRRVGLVHGWGSSEGLEDRILASLPQGLDLVVYGHSHRPRRAERGETLLVNPGSAFDRRSAPACTVALVELGCSGMGVRFEEVGC